MMSSEEGLSILKKMQEESSRVYVVFVEHRREERFGSSVLEASADGLALDKYEVASFFLRLEGVSFTYSDAREAAVPEKAGMVFDSCLMLSWPNGSRCRLFVIRDDFDTITHSP